MWWSVMHRFIKSYDVPIENVKGLVYFCCYGNQFPGDSGLSNIPVV